MKPGERVRLIQESSSILDKRAWPEAQLVLDQFGFPTYEPNWNSWNTQVESYDYFINQDSRRPGPFGPGLICSSDWRGQDLNLQPSGLSSPKV
jgi:hypothetical protein